MDYDPPTPVERVLTRNRWIRIFVVLAVLAAALYYLIFVNQYVVAYRDGLNHFKYGSIGSEPICRDSRVPLSSSGSPNSRPRRTPQSG